MKFTWSKADKEGNLSGQAGRGVYATIAPDGKRFAVNVFRTKHNRQVCAIFKADIETVEDAKNYAEKAYDLVKPRDK